jgi:DNA transposition AAA+ family ATPase
MPSDIPPSTEDRARHEDERIRLAERVLVLKSDRSLSWEALGREMGVTHQTLQLWATGKYAGRIDRVNDGVRRYFEAGAQRQAMALDALVEPGFVATPTADAFHALFRQAQFLPTIVSVVGAPGVGKTRAAEEYAGLSPNVWMVTALSGHPSGRWLLEELARVMRLTERGGSQRLASVIIDRLRGSRALLTVDEANHLASATLDLLRGIHDQAKCGIALVGNPRVISRLEGSRDSDFAQLFRRLGGRINRAKPTKADVDRLLAAWGVEDQETQQLLRAAAARPGALGGMTMTLRLAQMLAASQGQALSAAHILAADQQIRGETAA